MGFWFSSTTLESCESLNNDGANATIAKISRSFREVSRSFCKFFEVFVASGTRLDLFGPARMRSDAIGCIGKRSDGRVCATYRRSHRRRKSPKCALSSRLVVVVCCLLLLLYPKKPKPASPGNKSPATPWSPVCGSLVYLPPIVLPPRWAENGIYLRFFPPPPPPPPTPPCTSASSSQDRNVFKPRRNVF